MGLRWCSFFILISQNIHHIYAGRKTSKNISQRALISCYTTKVEDVFNRYFAVEKLCWYRHSNPRPSNPVVPHLSRIFLTGLGHFWNAWQLEYILRQSLCSIKEILFLAICAVFVKKSCHEFFSKIQFSEEKNSEPKFFKREKFWRLEWWFRNRMALGLVVVRGQLSKSFLKSRVWCPETFRRILAPQTRLWFNVVEGLRKLNFVALQSLLIGRRVTRSL